MKAQLTRKNYFAMKTEPTAEMLLVLFHDETPSPYNWPELLDSYSKQFSKLIVRTIHISECHTSLTSYLDELAPGLPQFHLFHPHIFDTQVLHGLAPLDLFNIISEYQTYYESQFELDKEKKFKALEKMLKAARVIIFIKGTPLEPACGFSAKLVNLLNKSMVKYKSFDIMKDNGVRAWLRVFSGWKTYPQLYIDGKIVGGVDKVQELIENDEFLDILPRECTFEGVKETVAELLNQHKVYLFSVVSS